MWGACSVGPVLRQRLEQAGLAGPLPIQEAAFVPISQGRNVVIGSATGSGKTLAFLLPLLATSSRTRPCTHLVVTASAELAVQLQREVDRLWPPRPASTAGAAPVSALHVVGGGARVRGDDGDGDSWFAGGEGAEATRVDAEDTTRAELLGVGEAPVLVGTPHALRRLFAQARTAAAYGGAGAEQASQLSSNLKTIVLDEADQLLGSASVVAVEVQRKALSAEQGAPITARQRALLRARVQPSVTERLLAELPVPLPQLQLVCASATVGRALRRQLQALLGAPSVEKAATLVALEDRDVKRLAARRSALVPPTLSHVYMLLPPPPPPLPLPRVAGKAGEAFEMAEAGTAVADEDAETAPKTAPKTAPMTAPDEATPVEGAVSDATDEAANVLLGALWSAMGRVAPAPAIVFTGKLGVERIIEALAARGLRRVLSVRDASDAKPPTVEPNAQDDAPNAQDGAETECAQDDASNAKHPTVVPNAQDGADGWADTPVYVGSERWGRGLDLDVDYVFLLAPPASSASYTHLAGRTARKGRRGTAVTLLTPSQAPRVVAFAEALGLAFEAL